jgi:hypothetical protein
MTNETCRGVLMIENNLTFTANCVKFRTDRDENDEFNLSTTHSIYFGESDPGQDDHAWTFCGVGELGVGIIRGRKKHVLYESIQEFVLSRSRLECVFNERGIPETGINTLTILYDISDESWGGLAHIARGVFGTFNYFKLIN